jgi:sugar phosphate isomerase/epimerase
MKPTAYSPSRRQFLATAGAASLSLLSSSNAATFKTVIKKAKIIGKPEEQALRDLKAAGFDGVEVSFLFDDETEAKKARELVEGIGLKVHSVLRGWAEFNSDDPGQVPRAMRSRRRRCARRTGSARRRSCSCHAVSAGRR